ncbi:MAG: rod shape-determining protein MreC [Candidatus Aminicenantales bacterium]
MPFSWKRHKGFVVLVSLILLQFVLISVQVPLGEDESVFERAIFSVFSPVQHAGVAVYTGIGKVFRNYFRLIRTQAENSLLLQENFSLRQENTLLKSILKTYRAEEEIAQVLQDLGKAILPARVIGLDASNYWRSLVINKGSEDGVRINMVVLDRHGYLVGRVVDPVSFREARVQLITDTEAGVHVKPEGKAVPGIVIGTGRGRCRLAFILSTDTEVAEGDRLVSTGSDGIYFPGLTVGYVLSVKKDQSLFKRIEVEPAFRIGDLDLVAVIRARAGELF